MTRQEPKKIWKTSIRLLTFILTLISWNLNVYAAATPAEIQEWLQAHNTYRNRHGVSDVTWSTTVAASAQAYADTCPFGHSGSQYGENLAYSTANRSLSYIVQLWYDEEPLYDYNNPGFYENPGTGHFTQIVWKGTSEIGCGYKKGCPGSWPNIWVCQYNPPGNVLGQFASNVFPPGTPLPDPGQNTFLPAIFKLLLGN